MTKGLKLIIAVSVVVVLSGVLAGVYIYGKGANGKFLAKSPEKTEIKATDTKSVPDGNTRQGIGQQALPSDGVSPPSVNPKQEPAEAKEPEKPQRMKNAAVKAVYLSGDSAGSKKVINHIIELTKTTELNAVVIDVKEGGKVNYNSQIPAVREYAAFHPLYDAESVIKTLHDNNVYVIGRVVCFRDTVLAEKRADLAVKKVSGQLWREGRFAWTNPYNEEVWKYNIDIAAEALDKGFDEIQFDYVRFPTTRKSEVDYGKDVPSKADTICKFLETAKKKLHDEMGASVSADVFGIICESQGDTEGIGQVLERVGKDMDCISPMLYPSHYANASHGINGNGVGQSVNGVEFKAPDLEPYKVVYNSLVKAKDRLSKTQGYNARVRPYLQAFTASYLSKGYYQKYGAEQIRQQIKAVYDAGYNEWILWDPANAYPDNAFEKKQAALQQ